MSKRLCSKEAAMAGGGGEDHLSTLPVDVIRLVLSFLPSRQAVRTCVLATRWRTLWKSVPALRVDAYDGSHGTCQFEDLGNFIHSLLHYRDPTPLHECEIRFDDDEDDMDEFRQDFEMCLWYAVSHKVRVLKFQMLSSSHPLQLSAGTLISEHLTKLVLRGIDFDDFSLDVLSCQSLQVLKMHECLINMTTIIFPKSLQRLRASCTSFSLDDTRSLISAPGLVTLTLDGCWDWTPFLKSLPSLVTASINIGREYDCTDSCGDSFKGGCASESCGNCYGTDDDCVLLQGLSGAANLELISHQSMIFSKDIKWCPVFSKLKTLLLSEWCMTANFSGLVYFLQHSPILERLTLELDSIPKEFCIKTSEVYKPKEQFLVSKHLKTVEISHLNETRRILQISKVLAYHGVPPELINIK